MLSNIKMIATPYSITYTDTDYDSVIGWGSKLGTKRTYSNIITLQKVRNLYSENIKNKINLFNVIGNANYFGNGIADAIGQININNAYDVSNFKIFNISSWDSQDSTILEESIPPSDVGCVYCPRAKEQYQNTSNLYSINFLGVYNSYIYYNYNYRNNYTKVLYCQDINNPLKEWIVNAPYNIYTTGYSYPITDNTGIYLYHYGDKILAKYSFDDGSKLWEYSCNINFLSNTQNGKLIMLDNTNNSKIIILNATNGNLIKEYTQSYFTLQNDGIFVDYVNGYILLYKPNMNKTDSNRIIILDSNGNVFLNLSITSSSTFWNRISGNYVWNMAMDKDRNLWIINSNNENYYLTKVAVTTSGIGTKQWEISIPEGYTRLPTFYQDERTGGMYIYLNNNNILIKHNATNGNQLFNIRLNSTPYFDKANQGMIYFNNDGKTIHAIRDNSYATNYYKSLLMS